MLFWWCKAGFLYSVYVSVIYIIFMNIELNSLVSIFKRKYKELMMDNSEAKLGLEMNWEIDSCSVIAIGIYKLEVLTQNNIFSIRFVEHVRNGLKNANNPSYRLCTQQYQHQSWHLAIQLWVNEMYGNILYIRNHSQKKTFTICRLSVFTRKHLRSS